HEGLARAGFGLLELRVAMSVRLLAVGGVEARPTRAQVAGDVLDDQRDGVGFRIERREELRVVDLRHRFIRELLLTVELAAHVLEIEIAEHGGDSLSKNRGTVIGRFRSKRGSCSRSIDSPEEGCSGRRERTSGFDGARSPLGSSGGAAPKRAARSSSRTTRGRSFPHRAIRSRWAFRGPSPREKSEDRLGPPPLERLRPRPCAA